MTPTPPPKRTNCVQCKRNRNRARLLLMTADALEAAAEMERFIFALIRDLPAESIERLTAVESVANWQQATEAINRTLRVEVRVEEVFARLHTEHQHA